MSQAEGRRVVDTTAEGTLRGLESLCARQGTQLVRSPLIRFAPPEDERPIARAIAELDRYAAVAFTSPRASAFFADRLRTAGTRVGAPAWAVGSATAAPLLSVFEEVRLSHTGEAGAAEGLAEALIAEGVPSPVLFPCGDLRRAALERRLGDAGIEVDPVICYRSVLAPDATAAAACVGADVVLVGSPSVARLLAGAIAKPQRPLLLALGPTTRAEAEQHGWRPDRTADGTDAAQVADALAALFARMA